MSFLWDLYWPLLTAAAVIGVITGRLGYKLPARVVRMSPIAASGT